MGEKVTVFKSFVVNLMGRTPHLPVTGEIVKGTAFKMGSGDKGFSQGVAAHKTGADVTMVTGLGRDAFADITLDTVNELHMDTREVLHPETTETGCTLIMVDENNSQNEIVVILGTCDTIIDQRVDPLEDLVGRSEYLLMQLETNASSVERIVNTAYGKDVRVILNTAPVQPVSDELLGKIDLTIPNEVEIEILAGIKVDSKEATDKATDWLFPKRVKNVLITLGHRGIYINTRERKGIIPAYKAEAVDAIGAGDILNGGLLTVLAEGKNLWEAIDFANALAALSVQKIGTTPSMPVREKTDAFTVANRQTADY